MELKLPDISTFSDVFPWFLRLTCRRRRHLRHVGTTSRELLPLLSLFLSGHMHTSRHEHVLTMKKRKQEGAVS